MVCYPRVPRQQQTARASQKQPEQPEQPARVTGSLAVLACFVAALTGGQWKDWARLVRWPTPPLLPRIILNPTVHSTACLTRGCQGTRATGPQGRFFFAVPDTHLPLSLSLPLIRSPRLQAAGCKTNQPTNEANERNEAWSALGACRSECALTGRRKRDAGDRQQDKHSLSSFLFV